MPEKKEKELARDVFARSEDAKTAWIDRPFIRSVVKQVQAVDPDIGAFLYPETKQIIFFWKRVIVHKIILNEFNTETLKIEDHVKKVRTVVNGIKMGLIPIYEVKKGVANINLKSAKGLN